MEFSRELLFFFSLLGVFNALLLASYFFFGGKEKQFTNAYLGALMLMLVIRVGKSVFYYFNGSLHSTYIHLGLAACLAVGPLLFLFIRSQQKNDSSFRPLTLLHFLPVLILLLFGEFYASYHSDRALWSVFIKIIYLQWGSYCLLSWYSYFKFSKQLDVGRKRWVISILSGVSLIWAAYFTSGFTSYIAGALSFSVVVYWMVFILISKISAKQSVKKERKSSAKVSLVMEAEEIEQKLLVALEEKEFFKNANLRMSELAREISISPHQLSHYVNEHLKMSFSQLINSYRIEEAKKLLVEHPELTVEAIGYESGFNSPSSFYTTFKNSTGQTPAQFRDRQKEDLSLKL